jgi:hypothetical protein
MVLYGQFNWHYQDLCLFHQAIYSQIKERRSALELLVCNNRAFLMGNEDDEWAAVMQSRLRERVYIHDEETQSMENFADQLILGGLWAMIEQCCGRTLIEAEAAFHRQPSNLAAPHKWFELSKRFGKMGVWDTKQVSIPRYCGSRIQ